MPGRYVYSGDGRRASVYRCAVIIFCVRLLQVCSFSYDGQYQSLDEWNEQTVRLSRFFFINQSPTRSALRHVIEMQTIRSVDDFLRLENIIARQRMSGLTFLYRGQSNASWPIQSTLFRKFGKSWNENECWGKYLECYEFIRDNMVSQEILSYKPYFENADFYILSMLRHLGFPCHLIDWSASLRIATIFACSESPDTDGSLWVLTTDLQFNEKPIVVSPFEVENPELICKEFDLIPDGKGFSDFPVGRLRRFRQNGFMSIIPCKYISDEFESLLNGNQSLHKIVISAESKGILMESLKGYEMMSNYLMGQDAKD